MGSLSLTARQQRELDEQLRSTADANVYRRTLAILEVGAGQSVTEVARILRVSRVSVHHWVACYGQSRQAACLLDHREGHRGSVWTEEFVAVLLDGLNRPPEHFGYQAVEWTVPLLREHLERWGGQPVSQRSIRRRLHELDYAWNRPRHVLIPDPEREKKTLDSPENPQIARPAGRSVRG